MPRLGDVCTVVSGTTPKTSIPEYWDGDINWITPAELNEDTVVINESKRKITNAGARSCGLSPFPAGTVILSSRAPIGKTAIAGTEMYCNQGFKNLICSEQIFNKYLFWFLRCNTEMLNSLGRGATFKEISKSIVENIEIPLPDLPTQRRIAATLDKVSEGIAVCRQMLTDLDVMVKSQFIEVIEPILQSKATIPLDELVEDDRPITYGILKPGTGCPGGVPVVKVKDMKNGKIDQTDLLLTSPEIDNQYRRSRLKAGDLLISIRGSVGRMAEVPENLENANITQDTARLTIKPAYNRVYVRAVLESHPMQLDMERNIRGVAVKGINIGYLRELGIPMCDRAEQDRLAALYQQADKSKFVVQQQLAELETLKKSLMQEYFE